MGRHVSFEVFFSESEQPPVPQKSASDDTRILADRVKKAVDSCESWRIIPSDLFEHTCKYLRLSDINALGTSYSYFAHLIFGRKQPLPAPLGDSYHPFIVPAAYKSHLEARNTLKTPLTYRQYQFLVDVYRQFDQPWEPSLKIRYLDMSKADIDDATLGKILDAFPKPVMLNLRDNPKLKDLSPLADRASLQYLNLTGDKELRQLDPLKNCNGLRHLYLDDCTQITDLTALVVRDKNS